MAESLFNMCLGAGLIWTKKAAKEAEANKQGVPKNRVKISACTEPSRGREGTTDVIVYPEVWFILSNSSEASFLIHTPQKKNLYRLYGNKRLHMDRVFD